jgi:hypothetical protein
MVVFLTAWFVYKKINFLPKVEKLPCMLLSGFLMAGYLWLLKDFNFFFLLATSPLVYFAGLFVFQVISKKELESLLIKKPGN